MDVLWHCARAGCTALGTLTPRVVLRGGDDTALGDLECAHLFVCEAHAGVCAAELLAPESEFLVHLRAHGVPVDARRSEVLWVDVTAQAVMA